jgi:uncharacterized protein (TIGR01244 family)
MSLKNIANTWPIAHKGEVAYERKGMAQFNDIGGGPYLGPQPTEQDLQEAKGRGIRTFIDLRQPTETAIPNETLVTQYGLNYLNIPVSKTRPSEQQIEEFDRALQQNEGPFLLHCGTGMRAAMLLALSRAKQSHWTAERTFEEAKSMGFDLKASPAFSAFVTHTVGT